MDTTLRRLGDWLSRRCDGDWEHHKGVTITSLDNPGWWVKIDVDGTPLAHRPFEALADGVDAQRVPRATRWMCCHLDGTVWNGACDPTRLDEVLEIFLAWVE